MKAKLSKRVIDQAEYQGRSGWYLWNADIAGFGLRIYPSGRKSFVLSYRSRDVEDYYCNYANISIE